MSTINFNHATELVQQLKEEQKQEQKEALIEFLESTCDLFSSEDWFFYAHTTGKSIEWLKDNARYNDSAGAYGTMMHNAIQDGDFELGEMFI